jgi:hypothetical protein
MVLERRQEFYQMLENSAWMNTVFDLRKALDFMIPHLPNSLDRFLAIVPAVIVMRKWMGPKMERVFHFH